MALETEKNKLISTQNELNSVKQSIEKRLAEKDEELEALK